MGKKKKATVTIDRELCKGCTFCVVNCPKGILVIDREFNAQGFYPAVIQDEAQCTGCTLCAVSCPEIAIKIYQDEEGD